MTGDGRAFGAGYVLVPSVPGMSQQELTERSGLRRAHEMSNLERRRARWPFPASVRRLAECLWLDDGMPATLLARASRQLAGARPPASPARQPERLPQLAGADRRCPAQLPASSSPVRRTPG